MVRKPISFAYSDFDPSDLKRIEEVYQSGQFSPGPKCKEFELAFKRFHGRKHAFFVNSGTDALRMALLALKERFAWPDGSVVVVPSVTFVASVNTIIQAGLKPLFIDVGMYDYNLNPSALERFFECAPDAKDIKAIMPVHLFGQIADMKLIMQIAKKYDLKVIEDSCESIGSTQDGKLCGTFGDIACFSTYQCHIIATGIGGLALTDDPQLHELMRSYANHGRDTAYLPGFRKPALYKDLLSKRFKFLRTGYSCRPSEFEAALGIGQLERLDENLRKRQSVAASLIAALQPNYRLCLPAPEHGKTHSYMMFPIVLKERVPEKKEDLCWHLEKRGIETRDMMPIMSQPVFKEYTKGVEFAVASWIDRCGFYIPCHPGMTQKDIKHIHDAFLAFF